MKAKVQGNEYKFSVLHVLFWHALQAFSEPGTILHFSISPGAFRLEANVLCVPSSFGAAGDSQWQNQNF